MNCPKCGKENNDSALFCKNCGSSLTTKKCPECGFENSNDSTYCEMCGATLEKKELKQAKEKKCYKEKLARIFSLILSIGMIVFFSFAILISFAPYLKNGDNFIGIWSIPSFFSENIGYTVGSAASQIMDIKTATSGLTLTLMIVLFYVGIFFFSIKGLIKEIKCLQTKQESSSDLCLIGSIITASFFQTIMLNAYLGANKGAATLGIIIFGYIMLVLKLIYRFVFTFKKGRGYCFSSYICLTMAILQIIGLISTIGTGYLSARNGNVIMYYGFISIFNSTLIILARGVSSSSCSISVANEIVVFSMIFFVLALLIIVAISVLSFLLTRNLHKEDNPKTTIVFTSTICGLCLLLMIIGPIYTSIVQAIQYNFYSGITFFVGAGTLPAFVTSLISLGGAIASYVLKKKAGTNTYRL